MLSRNNIKKYSNRFSKKANLKLAKNAITSTSLSKIVINRDFSQKEHEYFSKKKNHEHFSRRNFVGKDICRQNLPD